MEYVSVVFWKVVITLTTLAYGFGPVALYWSDYQSLEGVWSAEAQFHGEWFMLFTANVALIALYLLWVRRILIFPVIVGLCYVGSYWGALLLRKLHGQAPSEAAATGSILGIDPALFTLGVLTAIFCAALLFIAQRTPVTR